MSRQNQQRGFAAAVADVCRIVGPNGAIIVPQEPLKTFLYDPQTFRSFCNVPVAVMPSGQKTQFDPHLRSGHLDPDALRTLSREWETQHRRLFIVAASAQTIKGLFPAVPIRPVPTAVNAHFLVQTLVTRPEHVSPAAALVLDRPGSHAVARPAHARRNA